LRQVTQNRVRFGQHPPVRKAQHRDLPERAHRQKIRRSGASAKNVDPHHLERDAQERREEPHLVTIGRFGVVVERQHTVSMEPSSASASCRAAGSWIFRRWWRYEKLLEVGARERVFDLPAETEVGARERALRIACCNANARASTSACIPKPKGARRR